jgi:protein-L-isoaspartate(D-aspartate) O-methyltransferase
LQGSKSFDIVVFTGSVQSLPQKLANQTKCGGRLFAVIGQEPVMQACIFTRIKEDEWIKDILFETVIPPLRENGQCCYF